LIDESLATNNHQPQPLNTTMTTKYDDDDWDELSAEVQKLFKLLGYTKSLWDNDKTPAICDKYFADLTPEQKAAATKLGYTETSWNESDESSSSDSE